MYNVDGKRPYRVRHIRQRLARPTYGRLGRPLIDEENGGIFVHLYDECTNPRKAIRRSDPVHHYGNRFSILYIMLSRFEVEAPGCEAGLCHERTATGVHRDKLHQVVVRRPKPV